MHNFKLKFLILASFLSYSCSKGPTLNMRPHELGRNPRRIIWIQVAGLSAEHLALLRFSYIDGLARTAFEKSSCVGLSWAYNLYDLRPRAELGFWSQLMGKKNIKDQCTDFTQQPVWKYLTKQGHRIGILENLMSESQGVTRALSCPQTPNDFLADVSVWKMNPQLTPKKSSAEEEASSVFGSFHSLKKQDYQKGKIYYDQSCHGHGCYSSLFDNVKNTHEYMAKSAPYFYLIRDFSYQDTLKKKEVLKTRESLSELNKIFQHFISLAKDDEEMLVLLTSSAPIPLELPAQGKNWEEFEKTGKHVNFHQTALLSPVFAYGARAENFCGVFEEAEMIMRLFLERETAPEAVSGR